MKLHIYIEKGRTIPRISTEMRSVLLFVDQLSHLLLLLLVKLKENYTFEGNRFETGVGVVSRWDGG